MSFMHQEIKYRGYEPVLNWRPTHAQPRPGSIEANACVKRLLSKPKKSSLAVISCTPDGGISCIDTNFNPPKTLMSHSVYEIAHCGIDVSKPRMFTCIVGNKGSKTDFFCHVFKCNSKEQAQRIVRAVASACTTAFQQHQRKKEEKAAAPQTGFNRQPSQRNAPPPQDLDERVKAHLRSSMRRTKATVRQGRPVPKLTDSWFRPSMSRGEVNTILRAGRIGDFIIRESQSRPGDYAISVQTGQQIWTGLIVRTAGGFQLGERDNVSFDDLAELVAFYAENKFMNDTNGYPLTLRLPDDTEYTTEPREAAPINARASMRRPDWRQPSIRRGPPPFLDAEEDEGEAEEEEETFDDVDVHTTGPSFEDIMDGRVGMPDAQPEWPASSDEEEEDDAFKPRVGSERRRVQLEPMSEREAFEMFMNQGTFDLDEHGEFVHLDDVHAALEEAEEEAEEEHDVEGFEDDFIPDEAGNATTEPEQQDVATYDAADKNPIKALADIIFEMVTADEEGCLGGQDVRPVLLRSGLDVGTLGTIWMEVDSDRRGRIDYDQLCLVLGMISQAQQGLEPDLLTLDTETVPAPAIDDIEL
eukprot:m.97205 g.97205  ORF g.97205 m.97205 type:complete len:584 (-) comp14821_c1_seq1:152-1903(-)